MISRRTVVAGAAWAVPVIALGTASPAFAASNCLGMNSPREWNIQKGIGSLYEPTNTDTPAGTRGDYYSFWLDAKENKHNRGHHSGSGEDALYTLSNKLTATPGALYTITIWIATQGGYDETVDRDNEKDNAKDRCWTANTDMLFFVRNYNGSVNPNTNPNGLGLIGAFQTQAGSNQKGVTLFGQPVATTFHTVAFPEHNADLKSGGPVCTGRYGFGIQGQPPVDEDSPNLPPRYKFQCTFKAPSDQIQLGMKFIPFGGNGVNNDDYHVWIEVNECQSSGNEVVCYPAGTEVPTPELPPSGTCATPWDSRTTYEGDIVVSYDGYNWKYIWSSSTSNKKPTDYPAKWKRLNPCTVECARCEAPWSAWTCYSPGDKVSYLGHNFTWTKKDGKRKKEYYWHDDGACIADNKHGLRAPGAAFIGSPGSDAAVTTASAPEPSGEVDPSAVATTEASETSAPESTTNVPAESEAPSTDDTDALNTLSVDAASAEAESLESAAVEGVDTAKEPGDPGFNEAGGNTPPPVITDPTAVDIDVEAAEAAAAEITAALGATR